jgi:RNA polymerase sigma-70 factor, ECF subfamily
VSATDGAASGQALERAWREERVQVLAAVARRVGDLGLAEDAVQEAFAAAARTWPSSGVPERPGAWLMTATWRKALDALRRRGDREVPLVERDLDVADASASARAGHEGHADHPEDSDEVLRLLLACCHPALDVPSQVALTLRHVAGLRVDQIAAGFLVAEPAMAKRLVRAREKIRRAGIPFTVPDPEDLGERLEAVRTVVYLVFTEGYLVRDAGAAVDADLCDEAVWLARQVHRLTPGDEESAGLLALLLLLDARRAARLDGDGRLVLIERQDRSGWDRERIGEARTLLARTGTRPHGPYQLQAAVALLHASTPEEGTVDWVRVSRLYEALVRQLPSPVVQLNAAVAAGMAHGPGQGLAVLAPALADGRTRDYAPLHVAHAFLLDGAGRHAEAAAARRRAAVLLPAGPQREAVDPGGGSGGG